MTRRPTGLPDGGHGRTPLPRRRPALRVGAAMTAGVLLVLGQAPAATAESTTASRGAPPGDGDDALQRAVERTREDGEFVSVSAVLRDGDHHSSARTGPGDLKSGTEVAEGAHYRVGSVTKTFVATVVLQLEAEGRLSLDDSVEQWLPGLISGEGYDAEAVTVRNLLQHTSGLPDHPTVKDFDMTATAFQRERWNHYAPEELVAISLEDEPLFPPADGDDSNPDWAYSDTNYVIAGMLIEEATGRDWREAVEDRIIVPLGLEGTYAPGDNPWVRRPHAKTYKRFPESRDTWTDTTVRSMSSRGAAAEMISTHGDMETFTTALLGGELLPEAQLEQMQRTVPVSEDMAEVLPGARYGLSLIRQPLRCGGHQWNLGGQVAGGDTLVGRTEDGSRSVVIAATGMGGPEQIMQGQIALQQLMADGLCGRRD
jgi:D-alanyl-D-alanine carboxypeptidase